MGVGDTNTIPYGWYQGDVTGNVWAQNCSFWYNDGGKLWKLELDE